MSAPEVLCIGEVLWDSLPAGLFLGGAPLNVASHLHAQGVRVAMVSRIGSDRLGEEALDRIARQGIPTELIQVDPTRRTGFVKIALDQRGIPQYEICEPAAWDAIELTDALLRRAAQARVIVFGCLAQRNPATRGTIERLCETPALKVLDTNLRVPYDDREIVRASLERADLVKLNDYELRQLSSWFGLPTGLREATAAVADRFACRMVCVTRGAEGAALWHDGNWSEHLGFRVEVKDTVGSGDAFLAALLVALLEGKDDEELLERANLMGAYVATHSGAVPPYQTNAISLILAMNSRKADRSAAERPQGLTAEA
jgi:fructokinase